MEGVLLMTGKKISSIQVQLIYQNPENLWRNVILYGRYTQSSILESNMGAPKEKRACYSSYVETNWYQSFTRNRGSNEKETEARRVFSNSAE